MKLIITGTPGTGKTTLAKALSRILHTQTINEKDFALKNKIGSFNDSNELEIPIKKFEKKANTYLSKNKNTILEGHVLCEMKLKADAVLVMTIDPEKLEARLENRNYPAEKLMDNVFCEGINYCKKQVQKNYPKTKIIQIDSFQTPQLTLAKSLEKLVLHGLIE